MTSRERVIRALEFDRPDRVPRDIWMLPIVRLLCGDDTVDRFLRRWPVDMAPAGIPNSELSRMTKGDPFAIGAYVDEWGCLFDNAQAGVIGEVKSPQIDDWSKLENLRVPWNILNIDTDAINRRCRASEQFIVADMTARPFERIQFLRGTENVFVDLADESAEFRDLLRQLHEFFVRQTQAWAKTEVDAVFIADDWGSQRGMLIDPAQWRRWFKPLYAEYAKIAHQAGKKILMHSDGHIFDIYEDLIEIGIDAVNSQLFVMDIEQIGRRFAGRITFWGEIDRQHILCNGTPDEARLAVARVASALRRPEGGVIAQFELGAGAKLDIADAVMNAWAGQVA
ncbi:MAG: methyltransferase [Phycisphaerales bacterium]|jgi:hypothetical protein|nr:methyltransferase [Phycisphaerales bacterium]